MEQENPTQYFYFPIALIQGAIEGKMQSVLNEAICYSLYNESLKLEGDNEISRFNAAIKYADVHKIVDVTGALRVGKTAYQRQHTVMVSISRNIMADFLQNKKTEFEIASFCAYAAIRSILGKKPSIKMTNEFFIARMFGCASISDMPMQFKTRNIYKKYTKRYNLDKIKKELADNWGLKYYGRHTRGFFVSFALPYESLVLRAESERKAYKLKMKKLEEAEVLKKVLTKLAAEN